MTREELDFIGSMNMCDEISNEAYKKIVCHCGEQEPCKDAISRQVVLDLIEHYNSDGLGSVFYGYEEGVKFANAVNKLPSVTPQPETGHWINNQNGTYTCDKCGGKHSRSNYCPNCGCRMVEPQESEG